MNVFYSKTTRRSLTRRTSTLPFRSKHGRCDVDRVQAVPAAVPSTVGRTDRLARSCLDCRDASTVLSHSAPDLFTVSMSLAADGEHAAAVVMETARCDDVSREWYGNAPYELCTDCGDRIATVGGQMRPLMDTPV